MKLNRDDLHEFQNYGVDFIINKPIDARMRSWENNNHAYRCQ